MTTNVNLSLPELETGEPDCADASRKEKSNKQTTNGSLWVMNFLRERVSQV
jgi:hypothetical protein